MRQSHLPPGKTRETLIERRLPLKVLRQIAALYEGSFLGRAENVLAFGLPGRGKTHVLRDVGHELVRRGHARRPTAPIRRINSARDRASARSIA